MKRAHARTLPLIAALVAAPACAGAPTRPADCTGGVVVAAGRGVQPIISWQPGCAMSAVMIGPAGAQNWIPLWSATSPSGVTPPVQVGGSPAGTSVWGAGTTLTAGTDYTVYVEHGGRVSGGTDSLTFTARQ